MLLVQGSPDLKAARVVADYLGTRHHEFHFTVQVISSFFGVANKKKNLLGRSLILQDAYMGLWIYYIRRA